MQMFSEEMIRTLLLSGPVPGKLFIPLDLVRRNSVAPSDNKFAVSLCVRLKDKNNIIYEHHAAGLWMGRTRSRSWRCGMLCVQCLGSHSPAQSIGHHRSGRSNAPANDPRRSRGGPARSGVIGLAGACSSDGVSVSDRELLRVQTKAAAPESNSNLLAVDNLKALQRAGACVWHVLVRGDALGEGICCAAERECIVKSVESSSGIATDHAGAVDHPTRIRWTISIGGPSWKQAR